MDHVDASADRTVDPPPIAWSVDLSGTVSVADLAGFLARFRGAADAHPAARPIPRAAGRAGRDIDTECRGEDDVDFARFQVRARTSEEAERLAGEVMRAGVVAAWTGIEPGGWCIEIHVEPAEG